MLEWMRLVRAGRSLVGVRRVARVRFSVSSSGRRSAGAPELVAFTVAERRPTAERSRRAEGVVV
jgi:hypothetical protein